MDASGHLILVNNGTTAVATSPSAVGNSGSGTSYHWVEFALKANGVASTATLYVDGVQQFSGTYNLSAIAAQAITSVYFGAGWNTQSGTGAGGIDDVIIWDNTGTTFNTFPLGPRRIGVLNPTGAGASAQFAPSAGAGWQCVSQGYSGAAYVSDTGSGNTDTYAQSSLNYAPNGGVVNAVVVNTYAFNPAGDSSRTLTAKLRSNSTNASGTTRTLPGALASFQDCFTADSTAAAWTVATVNAAQPGVGD